MTPDEAASFFRTLGGRVRYAADTAMDEALDVVQERAEALSSGTQSAEDLARAGHPYSRRRPRSANPEIINTQSGDFVAAWEHQGPSGSADVVTGVVDNHDPKADELAEGSPQAIARPLPEAVVHEMGPEVERILVKELESAIRF